MSSDRIAQLIDLMRDAQSVGDDDKVKEIQAEMFQVYGYSPTPSGRKKRASGSPEEGEMKSSKVDKPTSATMDATSNRATNKGICRGGGAAVKGLKFVGVR